MIPSKGWQAYETEDSEAGRRAAPVTSPDDLSFLVHLGMVDTMGNLTDLGRQYFT